MMYAPSQQLVAGQYYPFVFEYFDNTGLAKAVVHWRVPGSTSYVPIPKSAFWYSPCPQSQVSIAPLVIDKKKGFNGVTVSLNNPISAPVTVTLTSTCVGFASCTVTFTCADTTLSKNVRAFAGDCASGTIEATVSSADSNYNGLTASGTVQVDQVNPATCVSYGDPHILTFDMQHFSSYTPGDYLLLQSTNGDLVVESREVPCGTVACNGGFMIKYKTTVFSIFLDADASIIVRANEDPANSGLNAAIDTKTYSLTSKSGVKINVWVKETPSRNSLGISIQLWSQWKGLVNGKCGNFDDNKANDVVTNTPYLLTAANNLFLNPTLSFPSTSPSMADSAPTCGVVPPTSTFNPDFINFGTEFPITPGSNPTPPGFVVDTTGHPEVEGDAVTTCTQAIKNHPEYAACKAAGVDVDSFYNDCHDDYVLLGSGEFVDEAVYSMVLACRTTVSGSPACPGNCGGVGTCSSGVCSCPTGKSGNDCSRDDASVPIINELSSYIFSQGCDGKLRVTGQNFWGTVNCVFGTQKVAAYLQSEWELSCMPPSLPAGSVDFTIERNGVSSSPVTFSYGLCCVNNCLNGATCLSSSGVDTCVCAPGFTGPLCETEDSEPTITCNPACRDGGTCTATNICSYPSDYVCITRSCLGL